MSEASLLVDDDPDRQHRLVPPPDEPGRRSGAVYRNRKAIRQVMAISANGLGLAVGLSGRVLRATPLPAEVAAVFTFIDNEPRARRIAERLLGGPLADLWLAFGNAAAQGLAQGPLGLVTDTAHRANLLLEALAVGSPSRPPQKRRVPPSGPIERYADRSMIAAAGGAAGSLVITRSPRRSAALLLAGVPKASRMAREAFAASTSRNLLGRGVRVSNEQIVRVFDRIDTIVIDPEAVYTGRLLVTDVNVAGNEDRETIHEKVSQLFDSEATLERQGAIPTCRSGSWELGPFRSRERRRRGAYLALRHQGRVVARVGYEWEIAVSARQLVRAARSHQYMIAVGGKDSRLVERLGADLLLDEYDSAPDAIEGLQSDGCVVCLVATGNDWADGLGIADVGIHLAGGAGAEANGADLRVDQICQVTLVVDAMARAKDVSRQGVTLAAGGSALGGLTALSVPPSRAAVVAARSVNVAALAGIATGLWGARSVGHLRRPSPPQPAPWHSLPADVTLNRLDSSLEGLSSAEAEDRKPATQEADSPPSLWKSVAAEVMNPLTPILAGGAAASVAVGSLTDAVMVAGVTLLNAFIGGVQGFNAERAIRELNEISLQPVSVIRDGHLRDLAPDALVRGDVTVLRSGQVVPADCRILESRDLEVDESSLTGESDLVTKNPAPLFTHILAERSSMLYEGTTVAAGEATAVVVAVGEDTVARSMASDVEDRQGPQGVEGRLRHLTRLSLPVSLAGGGMMLGSGLLRRRPQADAVSSAVALAVASVPEGLPLLATMAQLASARRLSGRGALVRNPRAVEALGRVNVLCTDKTGTLTEGRIRLRQVSDGDSESDIDALGEDHRYVLSAALRASPHPAADESLPHITDQAVVDGAIKAGVEVGNFRQNWKRSGELPFEPSRGYHASTGESDEGADLSLKGAAEVLLPRCTDWRTKRGTVPFDQRRRRTVTKRLEQVASRGFRMLVVAERRLQNPVPEPNDELVRDLTFLGFLALSDRVRPSAADAVEGLRRAGVNVVMVTGDHPLTARGIALELGILNGHRVLTGQDLEDMSDAELDKLVADVTVFARVTPSDKVRIVSALQRTGNTTAMTGDGANDAPAIRLADVGIAVGSGSTPAARDAADLVVTDERIETIVDAIIEGRGMWSSVRDALAILLGGNLGEVGFMVASTLFSGRSPLSARQLLAVNLLTDVAPALAIAVRPPPRRTPEQLLNEGPDASLGRSLEKAIAARAATTASSAGISWTIGRMTGGPRRASTMALVSLVGSQLAQTVVEGGVDPLVLAAGGGSALVLAAIVQTPGLSHLFGCVPLDPVAWTVALGSATGVTATSWLLSHLIATLPTGD